MAGLRIFAALGCALGAAGAVAACGESVGIVLGTPDASTEEAATPGTSHVRLLVGATPSPAVTLCVSADGAPFAAVATVSSLASDYVDVFAASVTGRIVSSSATCDSSPIGSDVTIATPPGAWVTFALATALVVFRDDSVGPSIRLVNLTESAPVLLAATVDGGAVALTSSATFGQVAFGAGSDALGYLPRTAGLALEIDSPSVKANQTLAYDLVLPADVEAHTAYTLAVGDGGTPWRVVVCADGAKAAACALAGSADGG